MSSTGSWSGEASGSRGMRMIAISTFAADGRGSAYGQHCAIHHDEAQAQGERAEECGGTAMGTEVSGLQLYLGPGAATADCVQSGAPVQGEGSGTDAADEGRERGEDGRGVGPLSARLDRILRSKPNAIGAGRP